MQGEFIGTLAAVEVDLPWATFAVAAAGGVLLLLWGVKLARLLMVIMGAALGFAVASPLAGRIGTPLNITRAAMAFCFGCLGLAMSRIGWALIASALAAAACGVALVAWLAPDAMPALPPPPVTEEAIVDLSGSLPELARPESARWRYEQLRSGVDAAMGTMGMLLYLGVGAAAAGVLFLGLVWPQPVQALVSAPLGAAGVIYAALIAAKSSHQEWLKPLLAEPLYPLAAMGVLAVVGLLIQMRAIGGARRDEKPTPRERRSARKAKSGRRSTDK